MQVSEIAKLDAGFVYFPIYSFALSLRYFGPVQSKISKMDPSEPF